MVVDVKVIEKEGRKNFEQELLRYIRFYEEQEYEVEVQFSVFSAYASGVFNRALLIVREKERERVLVEVK